MNCPTFSIQPLESRRLLSANAAEELASALGQLNNESSDAQPVEADLRADHQALDQNVDELRSVLSDLAHQMQHVYQAADTGHTFAPDSAALPAAFNPVSAGLAKLKGS